MAIDHKDRIRACCDEEFAAGGADSIRRAIARLEEWAAADAAAAVAMFSALRELVDAAGRDRDRSRYGMMLALHDCLLRGGSLPTGDDGPIGECLFDEEFYLLQHPDVRSAVGEHFVSGFDHFLACGASEGRMAHAWRSEVSVTASAAPTPDPRARSQRWNRLLEATQDRAGGDPGSVQGFGINLIGYHSANLGLGVSARAYYRFFREAGLDVCPVECPLPDGRSGHDTSYADECLPLDQPAPHAVNVFLLNPAAIPEHLIMRYPAIRMEDKINVALPFWELPRLPVDWIEILNGMDVLIAASDFIKYGVFMDLDGPLVRDLGHPIYLPDDVAVDRDRWQIPDGVVAFVVSFEMASDINRKNPFAAIQAFEESLGDDPNAALIVKVNNSKALAEYQPHVARLREYAARNPSIRILDEVLSYGDVLSLFASCDVLISLHRAEGFGLCLMEAMTLGKPVIATGWSGNMCFTTEQNSCLVGYDLVPVANATQIAYAAGFIRDDAHWAEASVDDAAHWMRRLAAEPELRERIGQRAAADMVRYQRDLDAAEIVSAVRNLALRRGVDL